MRSRSVESSSSDIVRHQLLKRYLLQERQECRVQQFRQVVQQAVVRHEVLRTGGLQDRRVHECSSSDTLSIKLTSNVLQKGRMQQWSSYDMLSIKLPSNVLQKGRMQQWSSYDILFTNLKSLAAC
jgi:hypothetical protein